MHLIPTPSQTLRRLGANVFWGPVITREQAGALVEAAGASQPYFVLDRTGNLECEDCLVSDAPPLRTGYAAVRTQIECSVSTASGRTDLAYQPPYIVRYTANARAGVRLHQDNSAWTCALCLNTGFSGGATVFPTLGLTVMPKTGFALIFPGGQLYPHACLEVTAGVRYALVLMANGGGSD